MRPSGSTRSPVATVLFTCRCSYETTQRACDSSLRRGFFSYLGVTVWVQSNEDVYVCWREAQTLIVRRYDTVMKAHVSLLWCLTVQPKPISSPHLSAVCLLSPLFVLEEPVKKKKKTTLDPMITSSRCTLTLQRCIRKMGKYCIKNLENWGKFLLRATPVCSRMFCTLRWCRSRENPCQMSPGVAFLPTRPCNWSCSRVNLLVSCLMSVTVCQLQRFTVSLLKSGDLTDSWYFLRVLRNFCFCAFYLFSLQFVTTIILIYINV